MADAQMYVDAGGLEDNFDPDLVFQTDIIPTGGSVTINGPVDTTFMLEIAAGGLLSFNGDVTVDSREPDVGRPRARPAASRSAAPPVFIRSTPRAPSSAMA